MHNTSNPTGPPPVSDLSRIAQDLQIRKVQVENVVQLLDEGNTVPFITRYRKERTGGLNEELIRRVQERIALSRQLADRKQSILKSIEGQGKLTDALRDAIVAADNPKRLEDLYLPYKPKKKTLASEAREKGLEPLATAVWTRDAAIANLTEIVAGMVAPEKQLNSPEDVLAGVQHILAEQISEIAEVRGPVRFVIWDSGELVSTKTENVSDEQGKDFRDYFAFRESVRFIPPHRILAVNRGEKENILKVKVEWNADRLRNAAVSNLPFADHPHREFLEKVLDDALSRLLVPSIEREVRRELTEHAQNSAVHIFARNLRSLLLQPPLRGKRVLAVDPGLRTGCKLAAIDENGTLLEESVIHPHAPQNKKAEAKSKLEKMLRKHQLSIFAIGNGTACRETEQLVSELIADLGAGKTCILPDPPPPAPKPVTPVSAVSPGAPGLVALTAAGGTVSAPPTSTDPVTTPETVIVAAEPTSPAETPAIAPGTVETPPATVSGGEATAPPIQPEPTVVTSEPVAESAPAVIVAAATPEPAPPVSEVVAAAPVEAPPPAAPPPPPEPLPDAPKELAYVIVNEAGASDYSASPIAREEFPSLDATTRGTVSIGRRLQDPLSELVKIDPQHVGVGLYQHDVRAKHLKESLEAVIESCVNEVGVEVNTASVPLLRHVSGLNQMVARDLVEFRTKNGSFKSRERLKDVPGIGEARFTQAAGFLKILGGDEPLDSTWIHPESYNVAKQILTELGFAPADLLDKEKVEQLKTKLPGLNCQEIAARMNIGEPTIHDILEALSKPGRDPRDDRPPPIFKKGILKLEDLQPGMELKGTVLNVVPFGAFVDIGLKDTGLVHISQMANRYIKNPYEVVAVGDVINVWVLKVEGDRRRASLTMIAPGSERKPPERRAPEPRAPQPPREPRGDRPPRGQNDRGPRPGGRPGGPPPQPREGSAPPQPQHAGGPPQHQRPGGPPHHQRPGGPHQRPGGPPPRGGPRRPGQQTGGEPGTPSAPTPPPPPRKPPKPKPLPKLSQDALKGKAPLHTFGELEAFFKAKDAPPAPPPPPETPAPAPEASTAAPTNDAAASPPPSTPPAADGDRREESPSAATANRGPANDGPAADQRAVDSPAPISENPPPSNGDANASAGSTPEMVHSEQVPNIPGSGHGTETHETGNNG